MTHRGVVGDAAGGCAEALPGGAQIDSTQRRIASERPAHDGDEGGREASCEIQRRSGRVRVWNAEADDSEAWRE